MGANSKFHKVIGAAEVVVGAILDYEDFGTFGNSLILAGLATFDGVPGAPAPVAAAINTTLSSAISPMQILYGETKVSGLLIASDSGDGGGATDADYKYFAVAHSLTLKNGSGAIGLKGVDRGGGSAANYYIDANPINAVNVDATTGAITGSGSAGNLINYDGIVWIKTYDGSQTAVDPWLNAGLSYWASTAIGKGISYSVFKIHADPTSDQVNAAFPNGLPSKFAVTLQGQRVYDPRLDSTSGGSGGQRKSDPTTWTYSANPALCLRDYLVRPISEGGAGIDYTAIPDDYLSAAANRCDQSLTIPNGLGGTTTTVRFTCGVGLLTSDGVPANIQKLLDAMAGWIVQTGGRLRIFAGDYAAPTTTINEDWLCGAPTFQTTGEQDARWNSVNATFTDPDSAYSTVQTPTFSEAGAITADGGIPLTRNLNLPAVPNQYNAQYITQISAKQSRELAVITLPCNLNALDVDTTEVVSVTIAEYGLSAATYRIKNWQRKGDSSVLLTLQKANSNTYTDETFTSVTALGQPTRTIQAPPTPTNFTVTGHVGGISLDWDDLKPWAVSGYEVWRAPDVSGSPGTFAIRRNTTDSQAEDTIATTAKYWYKVRAKNYLGDVSAFTSPLSGTAQNVTDVVGGIGPNLMDPRYSIIGSGTLPTYAVHTSATMGRAASTAKYGHKCLQLTSTSSVTPQVLAHVASTSDSTKPGWRQLSAKKYSIQVWTNNPSSDANGPNFNLRFYNAAGAACPGVPVAQVGATPVYAATLDLTAASDTLVYVQQEWNAAISSGHAFNMQGFAIFEMAGTSTVVPDFAPAPAATQDEQQDGDVNASILAVAKNSNGAIDMSIADGGSGNGSGVENFATSKITDDAGHASNADFLLITNKPTNVADAGLSDAQLVLGESGGAGQVLYQDGDGTDPYWAAKYGYELNTYGAALADLTGMTVTTLTQWGDVLTLPNPGVNVCVIAEVVGEADYTAGGGSGDNPRTNVRISLDGGSSYVSGSTIVGGRMSATTDHENLSNASSRTGVPTGDICVKIVAGLQNGAGATLAFKNGHVRIWVMPKTQAQTSSGALAVSIPSTQSMSCNAYYSLNTVCAATSTVPLTPSGGLTPYTESTVVTAGTGTVASGATTLNPVIRDVETTADGGATHTTTVVSTIQDSQSYVPTAGSDSANVATVTIGTHQIPVGATVNISGCTPAAYNVTNATVTAVTATAIKYATASTPGAMTGFGTVNAVRASSGNCVITGHFNRLYTNVTVSVTGSNARCSASGASCTASTTLTGNASGGDETYPTRSNVHTSGGGAVVSGATSASYTVSETGTTGTSDSGVFTSTVTDGHSNSGHGSKTVTFTFNLV